MNYRNNLVFSDISTFLTFLFRTLIYMYLRLERKLLKIYVDILITTKYKKKKR